MYPAKVPHNISAALDLHLSVALMGLNAVDLGLLRLSRESDIEDEVIPQAENTQESALLGYSILYTDSHAARARAGEAKINSDSTENNQKQIA